MRRSAMRLFPLVAAALLLSACGAGNPFGDPIDSAANCTELEQAYNDEVARIGKDSDQIRALNDRLEARATKMGGDAAARGFDVEATICRSIDIQVYEVFDEIGSSLNP